MAGMEKGEVLQMSDLGSAAKSILAAGKSCSGVDRPGSSSSACGGTTSPLCPQLTVTAFY